MRRLASVALVVGVAAVVAGLSKLHASEVADPPYDWTSSARFTWSLAYVGLIVVGAYAAGLPDVPRGRRQVLGSAVAAASVGAIGISVVQLLSGSALLPRFVVFGSAVLVVPVLVGACALSRRGRDRDAERDRVVVIGAQEDATELPRALGEHPERPAVVVAVLDPDEALPTPGDAFPVRRVAEETGATVVVLDRDAQARQGIVDQVALLHERGVRIRTLSLFYEEWLGKLPIGELERVSLMFDIGEVHRLRYGRLKRLVDLVVALAALPVFLLAVPVVWVGDLVANRGPLFFVQDRVGKGGRTFRMVKFRTMRPGTATTTWCGDDDERITRFGALLRASHADELPQVLNVLRGDLSLVGPRPEQPHYVEELTAKLPYYHLRHLVQPGITGWAQVKYGYARSDADALEKLQYEFHYLRRQSLAVDARILVRTLRTILPTGGPG